MSCRLFSIRLARYKTAGCIHVNMCRFDSGRAGGNKASGGGNKDEEGSSGKSRAGETGSRGGRSAQ